MAQNKYREIMVISPGVLRFSLRVLGRLINEAGQVRAGIYMPY